MKILSVATYDIAGGAARAAYRLHEGLKSLNLDSRMFVQFKDSKDASVYGLTGLSARLIGGIKSKLDRMPLWPYPHERPEFWSQQWVPYNITPQLESFTPDVVHFHWIGRGFLPIRAIPKIPHPLVWTLHDMWALTGGCHYAQDCERWKDGCGRCPQLNSRQLDDPSGRTWKSKMDAWKSIEINIVSPSRWLTNRASESPFFRNKPVRTIPNGVDTTIFQPIPKPLAKERLNLPKDCKLIIFGADYNLNYPRKGFQFLLPALRLIAPSNSREKIALGIFGTTKKGSNFDVDFPIYPLGKFQDDESLALIYSAADIFIAPSVQDNLPNTVLEALACGTPCVAFNIGGMPDMIDHTQNGYLAKPFEVQDLAAGIQWILTDPQRSQQLCANARDKVLNFFSLEKQAKNYYSLYQEILNQK